MTAANVILVVIGLGGLGLGTWAAFSDSIDKFEKCNYHLARD